MKKLITLLLACSFVGVFATTSTTAPKVTVQGWTLPLTGAISAAVNPSGVPLSVQTDVSGNLFTAAAGSLAQVGTSTVNPFVNIQGWQFPLTAVVATGLNPSGDPLPLQVDVNGNLLTSGGGGGLGTVTTIPDGSTNGVTWTVATRTTVPTFTFSLGAITPSSISIGADPADAGDIRLVNAGIIAWEASPAGTDVTLTVNSSEQFVFSNPLLSPQLITPALGVATATSLNGNFFTTGTGTLTLGSATLNAGTGGTLGSNAFTSTAFVTATGGALTTNSLVLGNSTTDTKVAAGITTDGVSELNLGIPGTSVGEIVFGNATSGTASLVAPTGALGTYDVILPNAASTLPIYGAQMTYTGPSAPRTITYPDASFTVARTDAANTFTGVQSMTSPAITTSLTSPSATFALLNVTPATINFAGGVTTLNIGNASTTTNLLGTLALNPAGSVAGAAWSGQGTAPTPPANSIGYYAPASVPTAYGISFPSAPTTGFPYRTGTSSPQAETIVATIPLANGGTNGTDAANNGGVVWSNASGYKILAGTATARQMLQSGATATPAWSTTTWPATTTVNRLLWSSSANAIADLATANSGVLVTDSGGIPSISTTLPSGLTNLPPIERPILMPSPATLLYRFDKASSTYNLSAATLKNLRARLAQAALGTGRLDIVSLGTSLSAGGGATETDKSGSWPKRLQRELVALGYPDGGTGFIGGQWNGTDSRVTLGSGWTALAAAQYSTVSGANTSGSLTIADNNPSTVIDVVYPDLYTFGASWTIDGAAQTDIPYANTLTLKKVTVSGLANTPHTVVITPKTGTDGTHQLCITGVTFRQTTGVVCHVLGIGGITTASLASATFHAPRKVAVFIAPQLTMIETGANDGNPLPGTFSTNVTAIVTELLALNSDVVLMGENPTGAGTTGAAPLTIPLLYAIADTNNLAMVDWNDRLISWTSLNALGLGYADGFTLHLNSPGYAEEAKAALALFQPGGIGSTHLISFGTVPTIAAGAGAGTGPTVSVTGTDTAGTITVVSGTLPSVSSAIVTVTFNAAFGAAPRVVLWPANASASVLSFLPYVTSTTTTFVVNASTVALGGSTTYLYNYHVIQ